MGSGSKGSAKERELRRAFESEGWFGIRGPASAGGFDLIIAKNGHVIVIELKYVGAGKTVYFSHSELWGGDKGGEDREDGGITGVADDFGGHAYAVVRWKQDTTFYALPPDLLQFAGKDDDGKPMMKPEDKERAIEFPLPEPPSVSSDVDADADVSEDDQQERVAGDD